MAFRLLSYYIVCFYSIVVYDPKLDDVAYKAAYDPSTKTSHMIRGNCLSSYCCCFYSRLLCFISISVEIEILTILGNTSQVNERLHCPGRDGGRASRFVMKAAR